MPKLNLGTLDQLTLELILARAGITGISLGQAYINLSFWMARGDEAAALLSICAELVVLGGLGIVLRNGWRKPLTSLGGFVVVFAAAAWCLLSMVERLSEEAHERVLAEVRASSAYVSATDELALVERQHRVILTSAVDTTLGPQRMGQASLDVERRAGRLLGERERLERRLEELTPAPSISLLDWARSVGIEFAVLFGFVVFGPSATRRREEEHSPGAALARQRWQKQRAA